MNEEQERYFEALESEPPDKKVRRNMGKANLTENRIETEQPIIERKKITMTKLNIEKIKSIIIIVMVTGAIAFFAGVKYQTNQQKTTDAAVKASLSATQPVATTSK